MKKDRNRLFFCQTLQDTIAFNFLLPIRTLCLSSKNQIFSYCKEQKFLEADYSSEESFAHDLKYYLLDIPNFLHTYERDKSSLAAKIQKVKPTQIKYLRNQIYFTKSSLNPFFMASLDNYDEIRTLKMIFYLYIIFAHTQKSNTVEQETFFNFSYKFFRFDNNLYLIGPVMTDHTFIDDTNRLEYIKNIKNFFTLPLHTYELLNMINQRNVISEETFVTNTQKIKKVFHVAQNNFQNKFYKKSTMRDLATHYIVQSNNKKITKIEDCIHKKSHAFYKTSMQIKNNQILRDLEALEWFNDLTFQNLSFETSHENLKNIILNYLQNMLQADGYIMCRYDHFNKHLSLIEPNTALNDDFKHKILKWVEILNHDEKTLKSSYTYDVIQNYQEHKNPIKLVEDVKHHPYKLCQDEIQIQSMLSIPLIFDKRVFTVLHFISFDKFRFDEIDKRFLLKLSSALSRRYIENNLNSCLDQSVSLLEGLHKTINHSYLKQKTDEVCENIAKAFSSDGVVIWFNKREVFQTPKEVNELTILSQINFLDEKEIEDDQNFPIGEDEKSTLLMKNLHKEILVIDDINEYCTNNKHDNFFMKYKKEFIKKGLTSIMFVPIKNYEGKVSGAVMIYDKSYRNYNKLSKRMLIRISVYIGSVLSTITYAKYREQQIDERNLHESAQYLNIINSRAKDLEYILKKFKLPDSYDKHRLFLNIQDIKDFTAYTRQYLFTVFKGGKIVIKEYDELLKKSIQEIRNNNDYTAIKDGINQVLAVNKSKMHQTKDISYKNYIRHNILIKIPSQQLHDVLNNLINNAIKYGKTGSHIKLWDERIAPYFYYIYIENIGYPINTGEHENIFKKGVRGYATKSVLAKKKEFQESLSENKGIGLYLAKGIIKDGLDGNITLHESIPIGNSGFSKNVFVIKIPYALTRRVK